MTGQGAVVSPVKVQRVTSIPQSVIGTTPLIKSNGERVP